MNSVIDLNNYIFNNKKIYIILDKNNEPCLRGKDIATIFEYTRTDQAIRIHVEKEDREKLINLLPLEIRGEENKRKNTIFVNESGLYSLIMFSKKEEAKIFKQWVTSEVLPSIRKYGEYRLNKKMDKLTKYYKKQLLLKEEELLLNQQKELELQKEIKLKEDYKEYYNRIQSLENHDIIFNIYKFYQSRLIY